MAALCVAPLFLHVWWCVTHLEGFRFASLCHTGSVMHIYVDDEPLLKAACVSLVCLWLLGSTKMKLQLSSSTRCINNEGPTLNLATADGASHPGRRGSALLQHVDPAASWVGQDGGRGAGGGTHGHSFVPLGAALRQ